MTGHMYTNKFMELIVFTDKSFLLNYMVTSVKYMCISRCTFFTKTTKTTEYTTNPCIAIKKITLNNSFDTYQTVNYCHE